MFHPKFPRTSLTVLVIAVMLSVQAFAAAQEKKPTPKPRGPVVNSPEVMPDGRVAEGRKCRSAGQRHPRNGAQRPGIQER